MKFSDIPRNPSQPMLRQFGILCLLFFGAIGSWQYLYHHRETLGVILILLGLLGGILGVLKPALLKPIFVGWMVLAFPIGWIISKVLLILLFYGVFTPIGFLLRLRGYDPLNLRKLDTDSYWIKRESQQDQRRYLRQY
ncbi:MAG: hypothetical protein RLY14_1497 [Planctomycetota bacterium]|jgi:hypothetical protein